MQWLQISVGIYTSLVTVICNRATEVFEFFNELQVWNTMLQFLSSCNRGL